MVYLRAGLGEEALNEFEEAIRLRSGFTTARINRGEALQALRRWDLAAEAYRQVLEIEPDNPWAHSYLAYVLAELGGAERLDEAAEHCRRALELAPGFAQAHTDHGVVFAAMGRIEDALTSFRRAIELDPTLAMPWNNIGRAEQDRGRFDAAFAAYQKALELDTHSAKFHANFASLLAELDRDQEAVDHYRMALQCDPSLAEAHNAMAYALLRLGRRAQARAAIEEAIRLQPRLPAPRISMAQLLAEEGDFDQSNACARSVLADFPNSAAAYFRLATNLRERLDDLDLGAMMTLLDQSESGGDDDPVASLAFGIAMVLDARHRYDEAGRFFELANARQLAIRKRRGLAGDPLRVARDVEESIASFTPEFLGAIRRKGSPSRRPIFVVGMPRSGTTLTEQILASHPSVFGAGELKEIFRIARELAGRSERPSDLVKALRSLDPAETRSLADRYLAHLDELDRSADFVVDKMPGNSFQLGLIATLFPEARIIVCRRDPRDVAVSCWSTCFGELPWANDMSVIARHIIEHDRLLAHWKAVLPRPIIEVVYEDLVADFESQSRRLIEAVSLSWHTACGEFHTLKRPVRTSSLTQVRQPIYSKSVGRWRHYQGALAPFYKTFAEQGRHLSNATPETVCPSPASTG
jgi:tetratricopeptide (TPR) repeat protein